MRKKRIAKVAVVSFLSLLVVTGVVMAATEHNVTETLGGVEGDFFNVDGTMLMDSVKIGRQGSGGVTFFNGTIVNATTNEGVDNPVTFGDNVRIDGRIHRGEMAGPEGAAPTPMPVIINDDLKVLGDTRFEAGRQVDFTDANVVGLTMGVRTSYVTVPASALTPVNPNTITEFAFTGGALEVKGANGVGLYLAPINLPHGAKVTNLQLRAYDLNDASSIEAVLRRIKDDYSAASIALVNTGNTFAGGDTTVNTAVDHAVDNENNSYFIKVETGHVDNKVYDVRVEYQTGN